VLGQCSHENFAQNRIRPSQVAEHAVFTLTNAHAQSPPKMKMTTDIPAAITTPDSVETRLGTLKFLLQRTARSYIRARRRRLGVAPQGC
jgi:hypothetical protein